MTKRPLAFISYSHADQGFAARLAEALPGLGIEPWIDREGIRAGDRWSAAIQRALDTADVLVLILSPSSMASFNVADEWQYALDKGRPVLPVLHEPTDVHFQLGRLQYIDFRGQPFEDALPQLAESIGHALRSLAEAIDALHLDEAARARAAHVARVIGPPSGTVTFLFTDIEGSTALWESYPDTMGDALDRHNLLLRAAINGHSGYVFKTVGDAVRAAFRTAGSALTAAADAQRALAAEDWSAYGVEFPPMHVRMAIHTGEARQREGDYFGVPLNRIARVEAAARGGQVLLSAATERLVREQLPRGTRLRDLGEHRLRDLRLSEHIFQLVVPGAAETLSALRGGLQEAAPASVPVGSVEAEADAERIGAISPQRLRAALIAIGRAKPVADEAMLGLGLLRRRLAERGLGQTPEDRSLALAQLLHDAIRERLAALRGRPFADEAPTPTRAEEIDRLVADFDVGHPAREAWSVLHVRFVSRAGLRMGELPEILPVGRSTVQRRLRAGLHALAMDLREREAELLADARPEPEAREEARPSGNLPARRDRFVGRGEDLDKIEQLFAGSRLVTLTGPGGVGKTRLALETARRLEESMSDGAWLLELAGLQDAPAIEPALAALWQIAEHADEPLGDRIVHGLEGRRLLLVLDNCEHLVEASADLANRLLDRCPGIKILATSRVALEIAGESRWRVDPLSRPSTAVGGARGMATDSEHLLVDRLLARRPGLRLGAADVEAVRRICDRLEGLPLALELAAARAGSIPLTTLAEMIDERPATVRGGLRSLPARHQSIRASIDWSYRLLSAREQWAFECLSVFAGGFTLEAAEAVCAGRPDASVPTIDRFEVLDLLSSLVEQSLILPPEPMGQDLRYRMLQALRGDGRQRLRERSDHILDELELRHARHYHGLAQRAGKALSDARQSEWVRRLDHERENVLAAIQTFQRHGRPAKSLAIAVALRQYWSIKGALTEGRRLLELLLDQTAPMPDLDPTLRLEALEGAGHLARRQSDYASARHRLEASLELARSMGDRAGEARLLRLLGHLADEEARYADAERLYRDALAICRDLEDRWGEAALLNNIGLLELNQGHVAAATDYLDDSLRRFRELEVPWAIGIALLNRGNASYDGGALGSARRHYVESLAIVEELGDQAGIAAALSALAKVAAREGEHERADQFYQRSMRELQDLGDLQKIAEWLEARAVLDHAMDEPGRACRLLSAADRLRKTIGAPLLAKALDEHDALEADLRALLGDATYARERERGASMSWREAVADVTG